MTVQTQKNWQLPSLRTEGDFDKHRPVTRLELFFDLFFVAVTAALSKTLASDVSLNGILRF